MPGSPGRRVGGPLHPDGGTDMSRTETVSSRLTRKNKVGLVLAAVLGLLDMVAVIYTWRTANRTGSRVVAGSRILSAITALPALFVRGVPAWGWPWSRSSWWSAWSSSPWSCPARHRSRRSPDGSSEGLRSTSRTVRRVRYHESALPGGDSPEPRDNARSLSLG